MKFSKFFECKLPKEPLMKNFIPFIEKIHRHMTMTDIIYHLIVCLSNTKFNFIYTKQFSAYKNFEFLILAVIFI